MEPEAPAPAPAIAIVPSSSPIVAPIDEATAPRELGELAFRFGKEQHADVSKAVIADLINAGWTALEFDYARAVLSQTADPDLVKELRYARVFGNLLFNLVRMYPQVQAGRLHTRRQAGSIAAARRINLEELFEPVRVDGAGEILYMLKRF